MINVCYSGNKGIFHGILMSALSLARSTKESLCVIVLSVNLPEIKEGFVNPSKEQIDFLDKTLKSYNPQSCARLCDLTKQYRENLLGGKNDKSGYTPYAQLRVLLDLAEDIPDKLIYLDVDTICVGNIEELFAVDLGECEFGAVLDYMGSFWINRRYCNSGVLLLNMPKIREKKLFEKCRRHMYKRKMIMPDQTSMNKFVEKKYFLPRRFNEQRDRKEDTVIKHFCQGIRWLPFFHIYNVKQWERDKVRKTLKIDWMEDLYEEYDKLTSGYDITR